MYPGHPWRGEKFGPVEYHWYLRRKYEVDILFDVDMKPFLEFCKERGHKTNQLCMKIAARLSAEHLPQYMIALNGKPYPTRYPAGYVRPVREGADMLDHVAIREKNDHFVERNVRESWKPFPKWVAVHYPRIAVWLARYLFPGEEVSRNYALMVSRNPLRNLGAKVVIFGSGYRTMVLGIPYGEKPSCLFTAPHAFGNINFYEPFLKTFKKYMEEPHTIPRDVLEKPYKESPPGK